MGRSFKGGAVLSEREADKKLFSFQPFNRPIKENPYLNVKHLLTKPAKQMLKEQSEQNPLLLQSQKNDLVQEILKKIQLVSQFYSPVLVLGEAGTEQDEVAQLIHQSSPRATHDFHIFSCHAFNKQRCEEILFAKNGRAEDSLFKKLDGGTLFLEEIDKLDYEVQSKIAKYLKSQKIALGSDDSEQACDVRIIASIQNIQANKIVEVSKLLKQLYYQISVVKIEVPPLRLRKTDIHNLTQKLVESACIKHRKNLTGIEATTLQKLEEHNWPGNIMELRSLIEHAVIMENSPQLTLKSLPNNFAKNEVRLGSNAHTHIALSLDFPTDKETFEKAFITESLKKHKGKINQTALKCRIPKNTLLRKIKKYSINAKEL